MCLSNQCNNVNVHIQKISILPHRREGIGISLGVRGSVGEVWIFSGNNNSHLAILPDECCTQFTVVSIQSRFDTHVKSIRYRKL